MLDRRVIREQPDRVRRSLARRQLPVSVVDDFLALDADWRTAVTSADAAKAQRNQISAEFAKAKGASPDVRERLREQSLALGERIASQEHAAAALDQRIDELLANVPNLLADDVPDGADASANVEVRSSGEPPPMSFEPKPHWEIGERLGIIDFERGVRLARSRFFVIEGLGARLQRAMFNFFLERNTTTGFREVAPPVLVNRESVEATGHLSKFSDAMFALDDGSLFLSPTSEVQLVNLHRGEILEADALPKRYTAHTACFRQEAGAAGKDTRGILRAHQFEKVELVTLSVPEQAPAMHDQIVRQAESLLQALELPYRLMLLCSGDTGFASQKTYDLEVWMPGQGTYREISSCSSCGDFQARRAGIRYRPAPKAKPEFVHTLNGSALAQRTLAAILENYQEADGSVRVPRVLQPYMGGVERIGAPAQ